MKKYRKYIITTLTAALLTSAVWMPQDVVSGAEGGWKKDTIGWWYQTQDQDYLKSQWFQDGNQKWYYFDANGYMQTGWILTQQGYYFCDESGSMVTGLVQIDGNVYYLQETGTQEGLMQTGTIEIEGVNYTFHASGEAYGTIPKAKRFYTGDGREQEISVRESSEGSFADEVLILVNQERISRGLPELEKDERVFECAQIRAEELTQLFSHNRPDGSSCFTVLEERNVIVFAMGENIAMGQKSPQEAMEAWMDSNSHRANILNPSYKHMGVGCAQDSNGIWYWVQIFTS